MDMDLLDLRAAHRLRDRVRAEGGGGGLAVVVDVVVRVSFVRCRDLRSGLLEHSFFAVRSKSSYSHHTCQPTLEPILEEVAEPILEPTAATAPVEAHPPAGDAMSPATT